MSNIFDILSTLDCLVIVIVRLQLHEMHFIVYNYWSAVCSHFWVEDNEVCKYSRNDILNRWKNNKKQNKTAKPKRSLVDKFPIGNVQETHSFIILIAV